MFRIEPDRRSEIRQSVRTVALPAPNLAATIERVGLRRILDTVVDGYELGGDGWLELTKNVTDGDGAG